MLKICKQANSKKRYQKGWQIVSQGAKLLAEKYKVKKIVLFGSLLNINKVRSHSDIDLAVWGLSDKHYYQALNYLLELSPEFSFDLVQFELAPNSLQNVILKQGVKLNDISHPLKLNFFDSIKITMKPYSVLIGQIQQELVELDTLVQNNQRLLEKIKVTNDQSQSLLTYYMFDEPALNTFDENLVEERLKNTPYKVINKVSITTKTLAKVLDEYLPENQEIDFLSVDVENFDYQVLQSNNWEKYRPKIVLVECLQTKNIEELTQNEVNFFMKNKGYSLYAKTMNTVFFIKN